MEKPLVSADTPDWSRERKDHWVWDPGRSLIASIRLYQRQREQGLSAAIVRRVAVVQHRFWSAVSGADIPLNSRLGGGLMLPHPNGVVVHPEAEIGPNCLLFQQVTIAGGSRLGGHVDVGAGAKVLGVTIGDHVRVGANSVVTHDVPSGATVAGIPARQLCHTHGTRA